MTGPKIMTFLPSAVFIMVSVIASADWLAIFLPQCQQLSEGSCLSSFAVWILQAIIHRLNQHQACPSILRIDVHKPIVIPHNVSDLLHILYQMQVWIYQSQTGL